MRTKISKLLMIAFFYSSPLFATFEPLLSVQYAGEIGKYSTGITARPFKNFMLGLHYGVVPKSETLNKIETWALKSYFPLAKFSILKGLEPYIGLVAYHVVGRKYETDNHPDTPRGYYRQSSYRGLLNVGGLVKISETLKFYGEGGVNDIVIINSYNNENISIFDEVSLAMGIHIKIN